MTKPIIHDNEVYKLLRTEQINEFNKRKALSSEPIGHRLRNGDFRGLDLRNLEADGLDLSNAYFRGADLRGIDFSKANIEGASFCQARLSGCYFPAEVSADEIRLSFDLGVRIRYKK